MPTGTINREAMQRTGAPDQLEIAEQVWALRIALPGSAGGIFARIGWAKASKSPFIVPGSWC